FFPSWWEQCTSGNLAPLSGAQVSLLHAFLWQRTGSPLLWIALSGGSKIMRLLKLRRIAMQQENERICASLSELLARYVSKQAGCIQAGGLAPEPGGEVELHDAGPAQAVDPRLAWDEAIAALQASTANVSLPAASTVPDWRGLVSAQEPALDLAFCAGNFPQMVRNLSLLLEGTAADEAEKSRPFESASLTRWSEQAARKPLPQALLAAGLLRLAQDFERAERLLAECGRTAPTEWKAACENEKAALAWHAGRREEAA